MSEGFFLWGLLAGYLWGGWFAELRARREYDPATGLLAIMLVDLREKRRFCGRGPTITRHEQIDIQGESYTLSLASKGDPNLIEREAAS